MTALKALYLFQVQLARLQGGTSQSKHYRTKPVRPTVCTCLSNRKVQTTKLPAPKSPRADINECELDYLQYDDPGLYPIPTFLCHLPTCQAGEGREPLDWLQLALYYWRLQLGTNHKQGLICTTALTAAQTNPHPNKNKRREKRKTNNAPVQEYRL